MGSLRLTQVNIAMLVPNGSIRFFDATVLVFYRTLMLCDPPLFPEANCSNEATERYQLHHVPDAELTVDAANISLAH